MNNNEFIQSVKNMYLEYLRTHRTSTAKLVPFHGSIAHDLQERLGNEYVVYSLGHGEGKEKILNGRYMEKKVDIAILKRNGDTLDEIGGIGIKSIMTNYAQNANNYFENMLGETANLRCANKLYFQLMVLPENLPYFGDKKENGVEYKDIVVKNETLNYEKLQKYLKLSNDNISELLHTPNKMLLYLIKTVNEPINTNNHPTRADWVDYMRQNLDIELSSQVINFGNAMIYNNYEEFIRKVVHSILSI